MKPVHQVKFLQKVEPGFGAGRGLGAAELLQVGGKWEMHLV